MSAHKQENRKKPTQILLVDDDAFVHEMLELLIDQEAYAIRSATNVKGALILISNEAPDIIITDAMMPGESGFRLIEQVKADARTENTPIILLTILQQPDGSVMDASGKADFSVTKPLYLSDITDALERAKRLMEYRKVIKVQLAEPGDTVKVLLREPVEIVKVVI